MSQKLLNRLFSTVATFSLLVNSLSAPLAVYAQEATSEPTPTVEETVTPTLEATPVPTEEATPTPTPTVEATTTTTDETQTASISADTTTTEEAQVIDESTTSSLPEMDLSETQEETSAQLVPSIFTNQADYSPTGTVLITGQDFSPNTEYTIEITSDTGNYKFSDTVTSDESGGLFYSYQLDGTYRPDYLVEIKDASGNVVAATTFKDSPPPPNPEVNLDQCRNGSAASPNDCLDLGGSDGWVNGNAGSSQAHYVEGYSIPYRAVMTHLPTATSITLDLGYDIMHSDHQAIDYLTYDDRLEPHTPFGHLAETVTPTDGVSGVSGTTTTYPIPAPNSTASPVAGQPTTSFNNLPAGERVMTLFGGTITDVQYVSEGDLSSSQDQETVIRITFSVDSSSAVLAWGGHIASRLDWGYDSNGDPLSAGGISGSPYHMRLDDWSLGNLGNTDKSLSAGAVIAPGNLTIIKDVVPDDSSLWDFRVTGTNYAESVNDLGDGEASSLTVQPGDYTISEVTDPTHTTDPTYTTSVSCTDDSTGSDSVSVSIASNETVTCTFTNTKLPQLTVHKVVINHGLIYDETHFAPYKVDTTEVTLDQADIFSIGSHTVTETTDSNYTATFSGACDSQGNVTLAAGDDKICTITNEENQAHLTVTKTVINHGLSYDETHFAPYNVDSTMVTLGVSTPFDSGTYAVTEVSDSRYDASFSDDCDSSGNVTLNSGDNKTCHITNEEKPAKVIIHKIVINHGLDNDSSHFAPYKVGDTTVSLDTETTMDSGDYVVSENSDTNYTAQFTAGDCDEDGNITLVSGETKSCTITNEEIPTYLTVYKVVINHGLSYDETHFAPFNIDSTEVSLDTKNPVDSGQHTVSETTDSNYEATFSGACDANGNVNLSPGDDVTCTITNEEKAATIVIHKVVINHGLSYDETHFAPYRVGDLGIILDAVTGIDSGTYTVSEAQDSSYTATFSGDCDEEGSVTVTPGSAKSCTITNEEVPTYLTVIKYTDPTNDNGKFNLLIDGIAEATDVSNTGTTGQVLVDSGNHTVSEVEGTGTDLGNYSTVIGGDCASDGSINLAPGDDKTCTITNTRLSDIHGFKWNDANGNGVLDELGEYLGGWTINLYKLDGEEYVPMDSTETFTGEGFDHGWYWFTDLLPGQYKVCEELQGGWAQTYPGGDGCHLISLPDNNPLQLPEVLNVIFAPTYNFGNQEVVLGVSIEKSNDKSGGANAGDIINYTLVVTNNGNQTIYGLDITDALPGGFSYVSNSTTGDTTNNPNISGSTMTWGNVTDLAGGASFTIHYQVKIADDTPAGTYKNYATCGGDVRSEQETIACTPDDSDVPVGQNFSYGGQLTPQVLGAATELPATGSQTSLLLFAIAAGLGGLALRLRERRNPTSLKLRGVKKHAKN